MPRARRSFSCVYGVQTIRITDQFHINFRLYGRRGQKGRGGTERGDCAGFAISPYPGNAARDTSVQRYLLTLPRNCPRFRDLHGIRSNFTAKLLLRRGGQQGAGKGGEKCGEGFSHFVHCACSRFDNARLARRHESDPRRPLSLIFHRCTLELSWLNPDYDAGIDDAA